MVYLTTYGIAAVNAAVKMNICYKVKWKVIQHLSYKGEMKGYAYMKVQYVSDRLKRKWKGNEHVQ